MSYALLSAACAALAPGPAVAGASPRAADDGGESGVVVGGFAGSARPR